MRQIVLGSAVIIASLVVLSGSFHKPLPLLIMLSIQTVLGVFLFISGVLRIQRRKP